MRRLAITLLTALALVLTGAGASAAPKLPDPCTLLSQAEAEDLAQMQLQPADDGGDNCGWASYPTDSAAQVLLFVQTDVPRALKIDRALGHAFTTVPNLGDEAYEEDWNIFVRKGSIWIFINLVKSDDPALYRERLEHAAALVVSRLPAATPTATHAKARPTGPSSAPMPRATGTNSRWTGRQHQFGGSVGRYPGVVYQPDVVLIGGGASAVRSVASDGLTWTIDARAPGASRLRVGSIMLATTLAAGRVLKLTRDGSSLRVLVGPVGLTDVVKDGVFDSHGPVPLAQPLVYTTTLPTASAKPRSLQAVADGSPEQFWATSLCCDDGIGTQLYYDNPAGRMIATVKLYVGHPTVSFYIKVGGGHLLDASLHLHSIGGLRYHIDAVTKTADGNVESGERLVPRSVTIPIAPPFALTLTQSFEALLKMSGAAKFTADGDYAMSGDLGFDIGDGGAKRDPVSFATRVPLTKNTSTVGLGLNVLRLRWKVRAMIGVGLGELGAGAWFSFAPSLVAEAQGSPGPLQGCVQEGLYVEGQYGVGFSVPEFVRSVINSILSLVRVKPIPPVIGPSSKPFALWQPPKAEGCP